jgi:hypothetical protein
LIGPGLALFITGMFAGHNRVVLPAVILVASSLLAVLVTDGFLPESLLVALAPAWPVAVIILALLVILPFVFRKRQPE